MTQTILLESGYVRSEITGKEFELLVNDKGTLVAGWIWNPRQSAIQHRCEASRSE